jgi:hypothetical protein
VRASLPPAADNGVHRPGGPADSDLAQYPGCAAAGVYRWATVG